MFAHTAGEEIRLSPFLQLIIGVWKLFVLLVIIVDYYRFKREAYRGSEYAGRVLADNGIPVIMNVCSPSVYYRVC